jgi:signal transduction histidine kinase
MSETIENMLNFTKIDSGRAIYTKKDLNLAVYLKTLIDNYEQFLTSKGFSLKVNISDAIPVIKFDREAFKLIFINLIQNSIKYSTKIKKIEIDLFFSDNRIIFKVADRGIGIPEKNIEMLFNKFYRAENNLVKSIEGSGLGLFLVKHALDEHDGLISIKNRDGGGTEVRIVFNLFEKGYRNEKNFNH